MHHHLTLGIRKRQHGGHGVEVRDLNRLSHRYILRLNIGGGGVKRNALSHFTLKPLEAPLKSVQVLGSIASGFLHEFQFVNDRGAFTFGAGQDAPGFFLCFAFGIGFA
ncbi:hypothetical protein SDC9_170386 [bioreactor metagenome]|uniref:Uncharacterized protein n=1 Tax=bioreactor metagenome TaxID=1076179 RepID=A0A645G7W9_9ZZZZ